MDPSRLISFDASFKSPLIMWYQESEDPNERVYINRPRISVSLVEHERDEDDEDDEGFPWLTTVEVSFGEPGQRLLISLAPAEA